ncbi:MAG: glycosyltransferase [Flavobacteriales bacterium]|nr:glycosyltransferase [Flavobacteriales bacterium]
MKKFLLIAYYWPPAGGGGVQRWLKMTKYLPSEGWKPIVFTPENGEAPVVDESLLNEVSAEVQTLKIPIWEPYGFYKKFTGKKSNEKVYSGFINDKKESFAQKASVFIRGNFFIPDARKFWIRPSIKFLTNYLKENPVDAIISTGPPHTTHLIALGVTKKMNIPWVADFRDPWTNIDFYDQLRLTKWADKKHRKLEQSVLKNATEIVTVSSHWADDFKKLCNRNITVIRNGFDHNDFGNAEVRLDSKFSICHIGSMNKDRNPEAFWIALNKLVKEHENFSNQLEIKLIGQVDHSIFSSIEKFELKTHLNHIPFLPHKSAIAELEKSQVLLIPINDTPNSLGVVPGKIYEYLGANRPILGIGPNTGDSAKILDDSGAGKMFEYQDVEGIRKQILAYFEDYQSKNLSVKQNEIMKYSRKSMAQQYAKLLNNILSL